MQIQMPIGSVGGLSSPVLQKQSGEEKQSHGFGHLLASFSQPASDSEVEKSVSENSLLISQHELLVAVQLLQASDLAEVESGTALLEQLLSEGNGEWSKVILEHLQLSEADLRSSVMAFLQGMTVDKNDEEASLTEEQLTNLIEELPNLDLNEALMSLVQILPSIPLNQMDLTKDEKGVQLAKVFKLLELFLHYEKPDIDNGQMKDLLQKTVAKLEALLNGNVSPSKTELFDKVFTPLVKEVNHQAMANRQTSKLEGNSHIHSFSFLTTQNQLVLLQEQSGQLVTKDQLIKQFETILAKSHFVGTAGNQKLFIKLYPEHLGALRIELTQQNSLLTAKIITTTASAKELLESQIQGLRQAFHSQNLQVESIEIMEQLQPDSFLDRDKHQEQNQEQEEQNEQKDRHPTASFEEVLLNTEA